VSQHDKVHHVAEIVELVVEFVAAVRRLLCGDQRLMANRSLSAGNAAAVVEVGVEALPWVAADPE